MSMVGTGKRRCPSGIPRRYFESKILEPHIPANTWFGPNRLHANMTYEREQNRYTPYGEPLALGWWFRGTEQSRLLDGGLEAQNNRDWEKRGI